PRPINAHTPSAGSAATEVIALGGRSLPRLTTSIQRGRNRRKPSLLVLHQRLPSRSSNNTRQLSAARELNACSSTTPLVAIVIGRGRCRVANQDCPCASS